MQHFSRRCKAQHERTARMLSPLGLASCAIMPRHRAGSREPQRYAQTGGVEVVRRLFLDNETFRGRVRPELMRVQVDAVRPVSRGRAPSVH